MRVDGKRIFRQIAFPEPAFDVLMGLKRTWGCDTNAEVITRLLLAEGQSYLNHTMKSDERDGTGSYRDRG
jgi:hypothetical protein